MSTILKALRRLEQDKSAEADRPLQQAVADPEIAPAEMSRRRSGRVAGALIAAAIGAGVVLLLQRSPAPQGLARSVSTPPPAAQEIPAPAPAASPVAPPPASPSPPTPAPEVAGPPAAPAEMAPLQGAAVAAAPPPAPADAPPLGEPEDGSDGQALPVAVAPPPGLAPQPDPPPPAPATPARVARLDPPPSAPRAALPGRGQRGAEAGAVVAQPVTHDADTASGEVVRTVEPRHRRTARAAAPVSTGVSVLHTVWHPHPDRRIAVLESPGDASPREYHEGDRVGSLVLLRIEPSGVVFERDGVEVREKIVARP